MLPVEYLEEDLEAIVSSLGDHLDDRIPGDLFEALGRREGRLTAVDGGSAVIVDGGTFAIVAARAGRVTYDAERVVRSDRTPVRLRLLGEGDISERGDFSDALSAWRASLEMEAARNAARDAVAGEVIAIDGAISAQTDATMESLVRDARAAGAEVAGVSKRSRLSLDGRSAVLGALLSSHARSISPPWRLPVRETGGVGTWIAMLHPAARHAFRVDATDEAALEVLAAASGDPVYAGYPYPLARVHNDVALHGPLVEELRYALLERCPPLGRLSDFHSVLDWNW